LSEIYFEQVLKPRHRKLTGSERCSFETLA